MTVVAVERQLDAWRDLWQGPLGPCFVGLSGGMDSTVLLHALVRLRHERGDVNPLTALHLNHGLSADAERWQDHCAELCGALSVPLISAAVAHGTLQAAAGSLEAAARAARYAFFSEHMQQRGAILLLAHHADDQAETLMLRMLQGRGLLAMPATRSLAAGALWRPLLALPRTALKAYAQQHQLQWLEDPSNTDQQMDRNYLRHRVLPEVRARWPGAAGHLQRVADVALERSEALATVLAGQSHLAVSLCMGPQGVSILRSWLGQFSEYEVTDRALKEFVRQLGSDKGQSPRLELGQGALTRANNRVCYTPAD